MMGATAKVDSPPRLIIQQRLFRDPLLPNLLHYLHDRAETDPKQPNSGERRENIYLCVPQNDV